MNELIRKFERESGIELYGLGLDRAKWQDKLEKFTELIVRECVQCSEWVGKVNQNPVEPIHTSHAINQRIRRHFGVEE